jgi:response regulator RpfG family c-di-GMP phosphodiesterase
MASGSHRRKILDLKPYLHRSATTSLRPVEPPSSFDFVELVDDTPTTLPPPRRKRERTVTDTWKIFFWMVISGAAIGAMSTPIFFLFERQFDFRHVLAVGFVVVAACILTAYVNYRVIRVLASRLLERVAAQTREMFQIPPDGTGLAIQATEVDRLDDALMHLLTELKFQVDSQKRVERNDLIQTITALATALEARDPYTQNHSRSVARLTVRLGRRMGLSRDALYELHLAGLLHDIGKIGVPDEILLKPARLSEEELRVVQAHVEWSYNILAPITLLGQVGVIARHHHERYDGRGYPDRLAGEQIPLGARIMGVVDMFTAMTEDRPYRRGLTIDTVVEELRRVSGTQIDPVCLDHFLALLADDGVLQEVSPDSKRAAAN